MSTLLISGPCRPGALIPRPPGRLSADRLTPSQRFFNWPSDYAHPGRDPRGKLLGRKPRPVGVPFRREVRDEDGAIIRMAIQGDIEIIEPADVAERVARARAERGIAVPETTPAQAPAPAPKPRKKGGDA